MNLTQILALVLLVPIAFIFLMRGFMVLIHGKGEYHLVEAFIMCLCIAGTLAAFLGLK